MRKSFSRNFENGPVAFGWVAMTWPPCWVAMLQIRGLPCKTWCPTHGSTSTARSAMVPTSSVAQKAGDTSVNSLARRSPPQPRPWGKMGSPSLSLPTWQPQRRATHQPPGDCSRGIAFPERIGCSIAGGNWARYSALLDTFAHTLPVPVHIVSLAAMAPPPTSEHNVHEGGRPAKRHCRL